MSNPIISTTYTTRLPCCEICGDCFADYYNNLDPTILSLIGDNNTWHVLCAKHKNEYDIKLNVRLRKEKLNRINNIYQYESTTIL